MHHLRAIKLSIPELENLQHDEAIGRSEAGVALRAGGEVDRLHLRIVVERSSGHDDAFLFVNQEKAPPAHRVVGGVHPGLELVAAVQAEISLGRIGVAGGLRAIIDPRTSWVEIGEKSAVVKLERSEVTVGQVNHLAARHALRGRQTVASSVTLDSATLMRAANHVGKPFISIVPK